MKKLVLCVMAFAFCAAPAGAYVWEWDCDSDPTLGGDFKHREAPFTFDTDELNGDGTWSPLSAGNDQTYLDTTPNSLFNTPFQVDMTVESLSVGEWGAWFYFNFDRDADADSLTSVWGSLLDAGATQTLVVYSKTAFDDAGTLEATYTGLATGLIDISMYIDTAADTVTTTVDGVYQGFFGYDTWVDASNDDEILTFGGGGGTATSVWDNIRIAEIPEPTTVLMLGGGLLGLAGLRRRKK